MRPLVCEKQSFTSLHAARNPNVLDVADQIHIGQHGCTIFIYMHGIYTEIDGRMNRDRRK